jgi:hypothetical protein
MTLDEAEALAGQPRSKAYSSGNKWCYNYGKEWYVFENRLHTCTISFNDFKKCGCDQPKVRACR